MDDLNDLIWTPSNQKIPQSNQPNNNKINTYDRVANYSPTNAFSFTTSPQPVKPNANKSSEIDPFAGLVNFQASGKTSSPIASLNQNQPLRSNSFNNTFQGTSSSNNKFGNMDSIPKSKNASSSFSDLDFSFFDNLSTQKPQTLNPVQTPTVKNDLFQDDPFDILLSPAKAIISPTVKINKPIFDVVDIKFDEKLAELVDQGYSIDAVKVALSMTKNNDVLEAKAILDENKKAEDQAVVNNLQPVNSKSIITRTPDYSDDDDDNAGFLGNNSKVNPENLTKDDPGSKVMISSLFEEDTTRSNSPANSALSNSKIGEALSINKEQLVSQASDLGSSMFTAASALFSRSKQTLQQTWGEIKTNSTGSSRASTPNQANSRGKQKHEKGDEDADSDDNYGFTYKSNYHNFKNQDSDDDNFLNTNPKNKHTKSQSISSKGSTPRTRSPRPESAFETNPVLPLRPIPKAQILPIDEAHADSKLLEKAELLRQEGNKQFKLGQFGQAETHYTRAIEQLPSNHPNLIVLFNNRATSRIKNGDNKGALNDTNQVLQLISPEFMMYRPSSDNLQGGLKSKINLHDQSSKALLKKAQAAEGLENFEMANNVYQQLLTYQLTDSVRSQAMQGIRRYKATSNQVTQKPRQETQPSAKTETSKVDDFFAEFDTLKFDNDSTNLTPKYDRQLADKSKAVQNLRAKDQQAAQEEKVRLEIVDTVQEELNRWKSGKEDNLRALLASVDNLLWAELEWKSVNLGHLVTASQVKKNYMKAISKLHPDKLKGDVSVRHKLIAENVFATLNLAWDSFKLQNQI